MSGEKSRSSAQPAARNQRSTDSPPSDRNGRGRWRMLANRPRSSFPEEQRERRCVAVKKIAVADRADFAVAEKSGQSQRSQLLLNQTRVVVRLAEEPVAATVATAQAAAVYAGGVQVLFRAREQRE